MVTKKKAAKKKKKSVGRPAAPVAAAPASTTVAPAAPAEASTLPVPPEAPLRIRMPAQVFPFGGDKKIFPADRPIAGSDIERLKDEAGYDLNTIEASVGISRRDSYYHLRDEVGDKQLPDVSMAILMRLYETFPEVLLPFQPVNWAGYLAMLGVHPGEFAQLVGRAFSAGQSWQQGGKPFRSVQLIIEAFWRAGVTSTDHPVYQEFLKFAQTEASLRGETLEVKKAPVARRKRSTKALTQAEESMLTAVDD